MSSNKSNNRPSSTKKYKTYMEGSTNLIPLSTLYRWQKKNQRVQRNNDGEIAHDPTTMIVDSLGIDSNIEGSGNNSNNDTSTDDDNNSDGLSTYNDYSLHSVYNNDHIDTTIIENDIDSHDSDRGITVGTENIDNMEIEGANSHYQIDNNGNNFAEKNELYENSEITVDESVFNLLNFYMKNNITKAALQQSLAMQIKILPPKNNMPKTLFHLLEYVKKDVTPCKIIRHYYCRKCVLYTGCKLENLHCSLCHTTDSKNMSYYFEFDLIDQIKFMFENQKLAEKLKSPKKGSNNNIISDITDSSEYIRVNSREDRAKYDLTLILNTDGLSLVKSSKSHCWPLMISIAELPIQLRESHIIMLGLWYDDANKPPMNLFLEPFYLKLKECYEEGISWFHAPTKKNIITRVVAPLIIADAPARAEILHMKYFNSRYGCNICEIETEECDKVEGQKTYRVYSFKSEIELRTEKRMLDQAELSRNANKKHVKGIKGYSVISCLPFLDISTCVIPEFMHSVLLGVVKQMINVWFEKRGPWNINGYSTEIDNFIASIRPPHTFSRLPRPLSQNKFYKALEFHNFLLFYSLPVLIDYLPTEFFQHWILLVVAIFNLLKQDISETDLIQSEQLLTLFVKEMKTLYSDRELTYNVHQLLHLALCVRRWGPLWAISSFPFENYNGYIAKSVHGNKHFGQEIINNVNIARGFQVLKNRINERRHNTTINSLLPEFKLMGVPQLNVDLNDQELQLFISEGINLKNMQYYSRAEINNEIFTSELYKDTKTNSHTIEININDANTIYGSIRLSFKYQDKLYLLCRCLEAQNIKMMFHLKTKTVVKHIIPIEDTEKYIILQSDHMNRCTTHLIRMGKYICKTPNMIRRIW